MPSFIIVEKNGNIKTVVQKTLNISDLYKKCGFKVAEGFSLQHTWTLEFNNVEYKLHVYAKTNGKAGSENKYEFPPPIDSKLFFGNCAIVNTVNESPVDINKDEFEDIMEFLQGGYEDIGDEDSEDEEDTDDTDIGPLTKQGYVKDDFVVDDEDDEEELDESDYSDSDESVEPVFVEKTKKSPVKCVKKTPVKPKPKAIQKEPQPVISVFNCADELVEEEYI